MELNFNEWNIEGFLIKRNTKKDIPEEEYLSIEDLNLSESIKTQFRTILKENLCDENNQLNLDLSEFEPFMSDDSPQKKYYITTQELTQYNEHFNLLIEKLSEDANHELATDNFLEYYSMIIKVSKQTQEFFYFRKLKKIKIGKKKKFHIHEGNIIPLSGDFIYFDDGVDFIYFKNFIVNGNTDTERKIYNNKILIFDRYNFKILFKIYEYCIQKATDFFTKFNFIKIKDIETKKKDEEGNLLKLKESFIQDLKLNEQITRVYSSQENEISLEKISKLKNKRKRKYKFKIENNQIKIENKGELEDLLDLIDEKISVPDWAPRKLLRYPSKGRAVD